MKLLHLLPLLATPSLSRVILDKEAWSQISISYPESWVKEVSVSEKFEFMRSGVERTSKAGLGAPKKSGSALDEAIEHGFSLVGHHGLSHTQGKPSSTVYELIKSSHLTSKFAELVDKFDDLVELLKDTSIKGTLFVPINSAFESLPDSIPELSDKTLKNTLLYHLSPEYFEVKELVQKHTIPSLLKDKDLSDDEHDGQRLSVHYKATGLTISYFSRVIGTNVFGTNGVIHAIDSLILLPPTTAELLDFLPTEFSTFELGLIKSGLYFAVNDTDPNNHLGGTIFAPVNPAFELLGSTINGFLFSRGGAPYLRALLKYHLVANETFYSDFLYNPTGVGKSHAKEGVNHIELPTLLDGKPLRVDTFHNGPTLLLLVNGLIEVTEVDGIGSNGVIQTVGKVLVPPKTSNGLVYESTDEKLSVAELKERLDPYLEN